MTILKTNQKRGPYQMTRTLVMFLDWFIMVGCWVGPFSFLHMNSILFSEFTAWWEKEVIKVRQDFCTRSFALYSLTRVCSIDTLRRGGGWRGTIGGEGKGWRDLGDWQKNKVVLSKAWMKFTLTPHHSFIQNPWQSISCVRKRTMVGDTWQEFC